MITENLAENSESSAIQIFPFHQRLADHFKSRRKTWDWFSDQKIQESQQQKFKTTLLKNSLRLDQSDFEELYLLVDDICKTLKIDAKVTLYQENNSIHLNTRICFFQDEAHIVFSGNVLNLLDEDEKKALLSHELGHYLFSKMGSREFGITEAIISALAEDSRSDDVYIETYRKFRLYLELFCDLCALKVTSDYQAVTRTLLKLETGLTKVNAESYLNQAIQITQEEKNSSEGVTHPELYIRSIFLHQKGNFETDPDITIKQLVEGKLEMSSLDLFQQGEMKSVVLDLIHLLTRPEWIRTESIKNLCDQYFPEFSATSKTKTIEELRQLLGDSDESVKDFVGYILMDFAYVDSDIQLAACGHALEISEVLEIKSQFEKILKKELKLTQKEFKKMVEQILSEFTNIRESKDNSLYND